MAVQQVNQEEQHIDHHPKKPLRNVLNWFFFSVGMASIPIFFSLIYAFAMNKPFSLAETLSHGELLIISVVLAGEVYRDTRTRRREAADRRATDYPNDLIFYGPPVVLVGACIMFAIVAIHDATEAELIKSVIDAPSKLSDTVTALKNSNGLSSIFVMWYSIGIFAFALIAGISNKWTED